MEKSPMTTGKRFNAKHIERIKQAEIDKMKTSVELFKHWDNGYWSSFNYFIALQGMLLAALGLAIKSTETGMSQFAKSFAMMFCVLGMFLSIFFLFILSKKRSFVEGAEKVIKLKNGLLYRIIEGKGKAEFPSRAIPSHYLVQFAIPLVVYFMWAGIMGAMLYYYDSTMDAFVKIVKHAWVEHDLWLLLVPIGIYVISPAGRCLRRLCRRKCN
jgi:hypothetical protein